jgi:hypothetical protein
MNVWLERVETALGEAEWAVTQTVHFNASVGLEWWCATRATAEKKVSSRHRSAIFFEIDCITVPTVELPKIYTGMGASTTGAPVRLRS